MNKEILQQTLDALRNSTPIPLATDDDYAEGARKLHMAAIKGLEDAIALPTPKPQLNWSTLVSWWESGAEDWDELRNIVSLMMVQPDIIERKLNEASRDAAVDTLHSLGYTYFGSNLWKLPVQPISIEQQGRCSETLRALGKHYPRICAECGLGPCKTRLTPLTTQSILRSSLYTA